MHVTVQVRMCIYVCKRAGVQELGEVVGLEVEAHSNMPASVPGMETGLCIQGAWYCKW